MSRIARSTQAVGRKPSREWPLGPICLLFATCALTFANSLPNGFTYDDHWTIPGAAATVPSRFFPKLFSPAYFALSGERSIRPLVTLSLVAERALWGWWPMPYHVTNIVLHFLNAGCLAWLVKELCGRNVLALLSALLFLVYPVNSEVVNAISFRDDSLAMLLSLLAILVYHRLLTGPRKPGIWVLAPAAFFAAALAAKEVALVFVAGCLVWNPSTAGNGRRALVRGRVALAAVGVLYVLARFVFFRGPSEEWSICDVFNLRRALDAAGPTLLAYARLALFPFLLRPLYGFSPAALSTAERLGSLLVCMGFLAAMVVGLKRLERPFGLAVVWMGLSVLPVLNVVPIANALAERHAYVPCAGAAVLAAGVLLFVLRARGKSARPVALVAFSLLTANVATRNFVWRDDGTLWADTLRKVPACTTCWINLGCWDLARRRPRSAEALFAYARRLDPRDPLITFDLATALRFQGRLREAVPLYRQCVEQTAKSPRAEWIVELGASLQQVGELKAARKWYERALEIDPMSALAYNNLASLAVRQGQIDEAVALQRRAVELDPASPDLRLRLGNALRLKGRLGEALGQYARAVAANPEYFQAYFNAGEAYEALGLDDLAARMFLRVLEIDPSNWRAHYKLSEVYARTGDALRSALHARRARSFNRRLEESLLALREPKGAPRR